MQDHRQHQKGQMQRDLARDLTLVGARETPEQQRAQRGVLNQIDFSGRARSGEGCHSRSPQLLEEIGMPTNPIALRQRMETRSEEHKSELQSLMRTSYAVFCLK